MLVVVERSLYKEAYAMADRTLQPTQEQLQALSTYPEDTPVVMVNVLRYKADGEASYERYTQQVYPLVQRVGGRLLWRGTINSTVVGSDEEQPHTLLLVEYPSRKKFLELITSKEYEQVAAGRLRSLARGDLLAATTDYSVLQQG